MLRRILSAVSPVLVALLLHAAIVQAADDPLANGVFLVAKPELQDPNFRETVVLITQPVPGGGPLGVVLNRLAGARLSEAWPDAGAVPEQFDQLYGGGPVARNQVIFLVRSGARVENGLRVLKDVYLSGDPGLLKQIVTAEVKVQSLRAYAGYAGWAPRQLQAEIAHGGWYMIPADADTIFTADVSTMWPNLIRKITLRSTRYAPPGGADHGNAVHSHYLK
jgi:putative transcriptional regulator